jgi:hypothetical protein
MQTHLKKTDLSTMATTHSLMIRVTLNDVQPVVWRTLNVPNSKDLLALAVGTFLSMGWEADAPFHFVLPNGGKVVDPKQWMDLDDDHKVEMAPANASGQDLKAYFSNGPMKLVYETPVPWSLDLTFDALGTERNADEGIRVEFGAYAGPPQGCGGKEGYRFLCETLANPDSPDYRAVVENLYEPFNPTFFSVGYTNDLLGVNAKHVEEAYCTEEED